MCTLWADSLTEIITEMVSGLNPTSRPSNHQVRRRGFIAAGLATAGAALIAPKAPAAPWRPSLPHIDLSPPPVNPTTQSLMAIPGGRVGEAVGALDGVIERVLAATEVPGLAASVVHRGKLVYAKGFGVRSVRTGAPVNATTVFRLASVSKSLSATILAGLVGRGRVDWTDPIVKHLPWFTLADPYVTRHVTIGDMFSHVSGLPDHAGDLLEDLGYNRRYILRALRLEPLAAFRDTYAYTNFGLTAGAEAAAAAANSDWATIAQSILFRPLAMTASSYRHSDFVRKSNRAEMHVRVNGKWEQRYSRNADPEAPAGGLSSNVVDLAKWMVVKLAGGRFGQRRVIASGPLLQSAVPRAVSSLPASLAGRAGFYGFGTNVSTDYSGRVRLSHSGAFNQGASTSYVLLPDQQLGIVVLTNGMPIGVPEAVAAYFMDLVIGGAIENDWLALYQLITAASYVNPSKLSGKTRPKHPRPARPAAFYVGRYANRYYGPITVTARGSSLHVLIGPRPTDYPLKHWNGDEFAFFPVGENALGISAATFRSAPGSRRASSLRLEYYDADGLGTFTRR